MTSPEFPPFEPHPLLRSGHAQTIAAFVWKERPFIERAERRLVDVPQGDQVVLHDDCPAGWQPGDRAVLLVHGLAGCHTSGYLQRIAGKLQARGVRTFRMDLRGCGAGVALTRTPYHAGRSEDAAAALRKIAEVCPSSPVALAGFSLGANIILKMLGEAPQAVPENVDRVIAVCPPIDLAYCARSLSLGLNRFYDRYFTRRVLEQVAAWRLAVPDAPLPTGWNEEPAAGDMPRNGRHRFRAPRGIAEFDDKFTAPLSGFESAAGYYEKCSSSQFVRAIRVSTLILAAADDPLVPAELFQRVTLPAAVRLCLTRHGGHLGFLSRSNGDPDRRWMDWRVVDWCTG